jgi:hypothetical protein
MASTIVEVDRSLTWDNVAELETRPLVRASRIRRLQEAHALQSPAIVAQVVAFEQWC